MLFPKIIGLFEILLYISIWILLICLDIIMPERTIPYAFEILATLTLLNIILQALPNILKHKSEIHFNQIAAVSLLGFAAKHLSIQTLNPQSVHFPALYYLIILSSSLLGKKTYWMISFLILACGETANLIVTSLFNDIYIADNILNKDSIYSFLNLFSFGFLLSILNKFPNQTQTTPTQTVVSQFHTPKTKTQTTQSLNNGAKNENPSLTPRNITNNNISDILTRDTEDVKELLYSIVYFMSRNFKAHSALGFIFNPNNQCFELNSFHSKSVHIIKGISIPLGKGIIGKVGTEKRPFMSGNLPLYNSDMLYYDSPQEINSLLAVPIISDQNELLGMLVLDCIDKNALKDQDQEILKRFSTLAAALITNARTRLFQEKAAHTFQIFYQASHRFTTSLNLEDVFDVLFTTIPTVTPCTRQISIIFDEHRNVGKILRIVGPSKDLSSGLEFRINKGLYSFTFQKRKLVNIGDYLQYQSKYYRFFPDETQDNSIRSLIIFPITDDEFRCRGIFSIESDKPNQFTANTEQILSTLLENASVAFTRAVLYQKMERLATTDGLTELNNHRHFQELLCKEIERTRRYDHPLSLLLLDIDHFKNFNDTYGHPVGDLVLKEIAACIRKSIRTNDIPARYGGEEFTVIIPETNQKSAMIIAERVRSTIENHTIHSLEKELKVTVSIGCATFPTQVSTQQDLIDCADKALYYSKEHGRNQTNAYLPSMKIDTKH